MNTIQSNSLLSEKETAALLHISPRKLQDDRANHRGLPYTRIVRKIFYDRKAIEIYLRENTSSLGGAVKVVFPKRRYVDPSQKYQKRPRQTF